MTRNEEPERRNLVEAGLAPLTESIALIGGLLSLGLAGLVVVSVIGRWAGIGAIPGDFELVQIGTALSVFSFLPLCQTRRSNIVVDTFTGGLSRKTRAGIDAAWDLVYAFFMAVIGYCLSGGAIETLLNGTNSMVLGLPLGPVFILCALLAIFLAAVSVLTALKLLKAPL